LLDPAWGYVDQPPLIPLIAEALGSSPVLLRLPATLAAAGSVVLVGLLVGELGGSARAQAWGRGRMPAPRFVSTSATCC